MVPDADLPGEKLGGLSATGVMRISSTTEQQQKARRDISIAYRIAI
jgi:hypothetical protein